MLAPFGVTGLTEVRSQKQEEDSPLQLAFFWLLTIVSEPFWLLTSV